MRLKRIIPSISTVLAIGAAAAIVTTSSSAAPVAHTAAAELKGAGSTLVAPMVEKVFGPGFKESTGIQVSYAGGGSSAGVADISNGSVDFGASDAPLTVSQVEGCGGCIELPWALSATGLGYNLSGVKELKLSGQVIAEIFLGQIKEWNNPKIEALNKGVSLPSEPITPVHRSDGSGDSYVFSRYLSLINSTWGKTVGFGTLPNWPSGVGTAGKGNSGVAAIVSSTPGAIGNLSAFYIRETDLGEASVQNKAGYFVHPYVSNVSQAAEAILKTVPSLSPLTASNANSIANSLSIVDCPFTPVAKGKKPTTLQHEEANAYPMSTFTYVLLRPGRPERENLKKFVEFAIQPSTEAKGAPLAFAPLPKVVEEADKKALSSI